MNLSVFLSAFLTKTMIECQFFFSLSSELLEQIECLTCLSAPMGNDPDNDENMQGNTTAALFRSYNCEEKKKEREKIS